MSKFKVFYSWQSDLPGNVTRYFIRKCIDDAIVHAKEADAIEAERDEATKDMTGSPNIVTALFSKIDECDLFVADVSLCFTCNTKRTNGKEIIKHSPNPNVLLELGYAVKRLGWEKVICLCNTTFGIEYPFDIAHNRITTFCLEGKNKDSVKRDISKILYSNIQKMRNQNPITKAGFANHIIGSYDFDQQKVIKSVKSIEIGKKDSFILHNDELIERSIQLISDINEINNRINNYKMAEEDLKQLDVSMPDELISKFQISDSDILAINKSIEPFFGKKVLVKWEEIERDKKLIQKWLNINIEDSFFDLGNLTRTINDFLTRNALNGLECEKEKYYKLQELSDNLMLLEVRIGYLNTFDDMKFIPLAIQNISETMDSDIHITVNIEIGEPVNPDEHLIYGEYEGIQGSLCQSEDDVGILNELFLLEEDGIIHSEDNLANTIVHIPEIPVFDGKGFSVPSKTEKDYKEELEEYIAREDGKGYYEFDVRTLNPKECRWLSTGILIKPIDGVVVLNYRINSSHSNGQLSGKLELKDEDGLLKIEKQRHK